MEAKVRQIVSKVLGVEESSITDSTSPAVVEAWDSIQHMNIVAALEEEFSVQFTDQQITEMLNYKLIVYSLRESLNR